MNGTILREVNLENDLEGMLDIEELCFEYPWTEKDWKRLSKCSNVVSFVVEQKIQNKNCIIGILSYELIKDGVEILNIVVHPRFWRKGIGRKLIEQLKSKVSLDYQHRKIVLHVRETNLDAQLFFRSLNFRATKIIKDHYLETNENAYQFCFPVFVTDLQDSKKL